MAFVACPHCGTAVDETALRCPACHADLATTMRLPRQQGVWCDGCGALVPEGLDACPICGMPVVVAYAAPSAPPVPAGDSSLADSSEAPAARVARIESALPADPGDPAASQGSDALPQAPRVLAFVVVATLVVVVVALTLTHPWDPNAYSTRTTAEADLSKVGFPGEIEALTSQDRSVVADEDAEGAGASGEGDVETRTLAALASAWERLGELSSTLESNEALVREAAAGSLDEKERATGAAEARQAALDVSNVIADVQELAVSTTAYATDCERVSTLGSWLRNWSDAINASWDLVEAMDVDATAPLDEAAGEGGTNAYAALFADAYDDWRPVER